MALDQFELYKYRTFKGLQTHLKGHKHRLQKTKAMVFATLVDLGDPKNPKEFSANSRAAGWNNRIYLDGFGYLDLALIWRSAHALRTQMLRIVLDPSVKVENHVVQHEGMHPLQAEELDSPQRGHADLAESLVQVADTTAGRGSTKLLQAELYCVDVESCGGDYPPPKN